MIKSKLLTTAFTLGLLLNVESIAQTACCSKEKKSSEAPVKTSTKVSKPLTSGCSPSGCRGAKTKLGEAKVISTLRLDLIDLKATMEKSNQPKFETRSYDIHDIIGNTDDESLQIIVKEIKIIEQAFTKEFNYKTQPLELPKNKAKQVKYLSRRIETLKDTLLLK